MIQFLRDNIRKSDIALLAVLIIIGLAASILLSMSRSPGDTVVLESAGKPYATYSLYEDREITVPAGTDAKSYNIVVIDSGKVYIKDASCKNHVCIRSGEISQAGETLVCLPNKLLIRIEDSKRGGGYDSITS